LLSLRTDWAVTLALASSTGCFADSQTNSFINRVLSANGLSNVIPTSSRKVERWDTWTNAKVVIGKSNGAGANKTEFNLRSLNIGMGC
jgi:hypothetical protein